MSYGARALTRAIPVDGSRAMRMALGTLLFLTTLVLFGLAAPGQAQAQTCNAGTVTYTTVGQSQPLNPTACDEYIDDFATWGGFFTTNTGDAYSFYGLGVDDFGTPTAENIVTANATYAFTGNLTTGQYSITLVSMTSASLTDTITLFMCPGPEAAFTCITTQPTTVTFNLPSPPNITTTTVPNGTVAAAYSQTITAVDGVGAITFSLTGGALPAGVTLSTAGLLSGTPTAGGVFNFTVTATDTNLATDNQALTLTVAAPTISVAPVTVPDPAVGVAYSQNITASGGVSAYTYAVSAGALPAGLTLSGAGVLSGTTTAAGTFNFTVTATDSGTGTGPYTGSRAYAVTIAAPTIALAPGVLPGATIATAYSQSVTASGGTGPYTYAVTAGALPAGVTLSAAGLLSGTPTAGGSFNFTVTATDSTTGTGAPYTGSQAYTLTVGAPTITVAPAALPAGAVTAAYSETISASAGTGPYTYAVTAGALPAGITLSAAGALSGTPTSGGVFNFTVTATDASTGVGPYTGSRAYALTIAAPTITLAPAALPAGAVGAAYSDTVVASGGVAPYTYAVTAGALPAGVTLSTAGAISGTPTAGGVFNFTVTATDSGGGSGPYSGARGYSLSVAVPTVTVAPASLAGITRGDVVNTTITASGGTGPYTFAVTAGALPAGVTLSTAGALAGTADASGTFNFTVTATDSSTGAGAPYSASRAYTWSIAAPTITLGAVGGGTVGTPYSATVSATGATAPYTFAVTAGALPTGLSLNGGTGQITGTPTSGGVFNFDVTATDATAGGGGPYTGTRSYSVTIGAATIAVPPGGALPMVTAGTPVSINLGPATGGTPPYTYAVTAGALPPGLTLNPATGELSGLPTVAGPYSFSITVTDSSGGSGPYSVTTAYTMTVVVVTIPTLSEWAMMLLALLLGGGAVATLRRRGEV